MTTLLLVLNTVVALALIGVILIQRSEGGGLGIGGSQGMGSFMTGRGTANLLTRATAILAGLFMVLCLVLDVMNKGASSGTKEHDILAQPTQQTAPQTTQKPVGKAPVAPGKTQ